jgi:hypothetical protein
LLRLSLKYAALKTQDKREFWQTIALKYNEKESRDRTKDKLRVRYHQLISRWVSKKARLAGPNDDLLERLAPKQQ